MTTNKVVWQEITGRGVTVALMNNFTSGADALKELIDNPIDYQWGQTLNVEIVKRRDSVSIRSDGGRGMGAEEIQEWLNWGEGEEHFQSHIGKYHQGGKAACGFLGQQVEIWAKRAGSDEIWHLKDKDWNSRQVVKNFGTPTPLPESRYPQTMRSLPTERGHVLIEVSKLVDRRWNFDDLRRALSRTYRSLIENGSLHIRINDQEVEPLRVALSTAVNNVDINVKLPKGMSVSGWAGRIMRDQMVDNVKSGLHLVLNGRLICDGEWFGFNHQGKGAFNSLFGVLHMTGFTPNPNKTDFVNRSEQEWEDLSKSVLQQLSTLIAELRGSESTARVSKKEKQTLQEVAGELQDVFESLGESKESETSAETDGPQQQIGVGGRKRPEHQERQLPLRNQGPNESPSVPRTPPPPDAVGTLSRVFGNIAGGRTRPPLRLKSWEGSERSAWTTEGAMVWLDINNQYPLYLTLNGAKSYLAETAILEICRPRDNEPMDAAHYIQRVDQMLLKWISISGIVGATVGEN